ncbi:hypothetical protein GNQ08_02535 [Paenibacillus macerans]|uniref:Uncharacterized protein n=2 Tax=Paenibacillus TaxID=44249 RepID=A0A6N8EMX4_PAEMA|nr:hypothetical protein [Paenibacillus macerans]MUG21309.1 hypothetical protein [Paenibacillus macerans]OMG49254.1 hypothetical protein BK140_11850 [Paenibacillus macerans]
MNNSGCKKMLFISVVIGVLIMLSPIFITGSLYNDNEVMGGLLSAELVVRTLSLVIGLIVIYDGFKSFYKK